MGKKIQDVFFQLHMERGLSENPVEGGRVLYKRLSLGDGTQRVDGEMISALNEPISMLRIFMWKSIRIHRSDVIIAW